TEGGLSLYGGWFYFAGEVVDAQGRNEIELPSGFRYWFSGPGHFPKMRFDFGEDVAGVEFIAKLPWVVPQP
ncbi:MAG: hypothetical protein ACRD4F_13225, partial [Candidatus Angelobacter sp.]